MVTVISRFSGLEKAWWLLRNHGLAVLWGQTWKFIKKHSLKELWIYRSENSAYRSWIKKESLKINNLLARSADDIKGFEYRPVISLIMPVWNTSAEHFNKTLKSILVQAYPFWELCIAVDESSLQNVASTLQEYGERDSRIKALELPNKPGMVGTTNKAIAMATGDFMGFIDNGDELAPHALLEIVRLLNRVQDADIIYTDEDCLIEKGVRCAPAFKPDWSPDLLMSVNYVGHLLVVRRTHIEKIGGFRDRIAGYSYYDLILRLSELTRKIFHIPQILYHWRETPSPTSYLTKSRQMNMESGKEVIGEALSRRNINGQVSIMENGHYRVNYQVKGEPLISIIIPTRDGIDLLSRCLDSIQSKSTYQNYEIIVVDNGSTDENTLKYLDGLTGKDKLSVLPFHGPFNYSCINNFAVSQSRGEYLLFLNNDTEVITPNWLEEMLSNAQRPETGAVGVKLLFPDKRIQHGGVILGIGGIAGHAFYGLPDNEPGYMDLLTFRRNCTAVTAACMVVRRNVFNEVGGFDEKLDVAYNDVDLCLKIAKQGYLNVWTPYAVLHHYESATRSYSLHKSNTEYFHQKWGPVIRKGDPFYNPNLTLNHHDYRISC